MGQINARDWVFQIRTATSPSAVWTEIAELTGWSLSPSENEEVADTTTFASDGDYEQEIMQRGATLELTGKWSSAAGTRDPGQLAVDAVGIAKGAASVGVFRFAHVDDTDWTQWNATVTLGEQGGETNDKTSWSATLTRTGAASVVAKS